MVCLVRWRTVLKRLAVCKNLVQHCGATELQPENAAPIKPQRRDKHRLRIGSHFWVNMRIHERMDFTIRGGRRSDGLDEANGIISVMEPFAYYRSPVWRLAILNRSL